MCTHKWKIQNISYRIFILSPGSCPRGGTGVLRGQNQILSWCLSIMLSPLKPLNEIQPTLVCGLLPWMGCATAIFLSRPWGPWEGSKCQLSFYFNYKVNFKDFYTKLCVCTYKWKIQNISDGIFIQSPGSRPRGGTRGCLGAKIKFRPVVCPLCYLLLNHWTKFNQIWSVSYSYEWGVQQQIKIWPHPLGRGQKVKYHLISITNLISKIFVPKFVCVLTNERYKTYQMGFSFCCLGHAPGVGLWGAVGAQGGQKNSNMVVWHIKSTGMTSRTECK